VPNGQQQTFLEYYAYSVAFASGTVLPAGTVNGAPSAQVFSQTVVRINPLPFTFCRTSFVATDPRIYIRLRDGSKYLSKGSINLPSVGGVIAPYPLVGGAANPQEPSQSMYYWEVPYTIAASAEFVVEAADYSGAQNTLRMTFHGAQTKPGIAPWAQPGLREYQDIAIPSDASSPTVAASTTVPISAAPADSDADYVVLGVSGRRTGSAMLQNLSDQYDLAWFNGAIHLDTFIGTGGYIHRFDMPVLRQDGTWDRVATPRLIPRATSLTGSLQDLSAANNIINLYLHGYKLFGPPARRS
jgi:hypothetical protein